MPTYRFTFLNHLGEGFGSRELDCRDHDDARDTARAIEPDGYPIEIRCDGILIDTIERPPTWLAAWVKPFQEL